MLKKFLIVAIGFTLNFTCLSTCVQSVSYDRYRIYKVRGSEKSLSALRHSAHDALKQRKTFDSFGKPQSEISYLVSPDQEPDFLKALAADDSVHYNLTALDLGKLIKEETNIIPLRRVDGKARFTEMYHSYTEIIDFLYELKTVKLKGTMQPLVVLDKIGKTFEQRDMFLVKVSTDHSAKKPIILFEAGMHAREWLAPASMVYMLDQIVKNHTYYMNLLNVIDFYVIPISNPDGYEFSRSHDRLWRKTRSIQGKYRGVDGNRNFDFHWSGKGSSNKPWSDVYRGPQPFSEIETRNIRSIGVKYANRISTFISVHTYGPYILHPWSYAVTDPAPQNDIMEMMANDAARAIFEFSGTNYEIGSSAKILYEAPGGVDDYFKGVLGVDLTFTFELSSADEFSFVVPSSKIIDIASEVFEGFKIMARHAAAYKRNQTSSGTRDEIR